MTNDEEYEAARLQRLVNHLHAIDRDIQRLREDAYKWGYSGAASDMLEAQDVLIRIANYLSS